MGDVVGGGFVEDADHHELVEGLFELGDVDGAFGGEVGVGDGAVGWDGGGDVEAVDVAEGVDVHGLGRMLVRGNVRGFVRHGDLHMRKGGSRLLHPAQLPGRRVVVLRLLRLVAHIGRLVARLEMLMGRSGRRTSVVGHWRRGVL